jgi:hypothetical protein
MQDAATSPNAAATLPADRPEAGPEEHPVDRLAVDAPSPAARPHNWLTDNWLTGRWARCTGPHRDRGMSTAEYAVGTIAACAFAALLFKVVSSPEVQEMLSKLIDQALKTAG